MQVHGWYGNCIIDTGLLANSIFGIIQIKNCLYFYRHFGNSVSNTITCRKVYRFMIKTLDDHDPVDTSVFTIA